MPGENGGNIVKQEMSVDNEHSEPETKCRMVDHRLYHEMKFQKKFLRFAEQLVSAAFLLFEVNSSPLEKDKERVSLQRFFYNYIKRTRLRLGIHCEEDGNTTDDSSDDEETNDENEGTMENNSNDPEANEPKEKDDNKQNDNECSAFMDGSKTCAQNPICEVCVQKGSILSVVLLDALSRPIEDRSGSSSQCGLQDALKDMQKNE